ncbi:glycoside hydrolase family 43 [Truepera radiovictrix DSM 17093]|uniref:Glycoside hydrolase family 43 n=1 Tax=Truepera radiovictrix (strain DSM 17093 / CIP 108686 / LMG 22925 / RQ-24) TaxID=649638 RepID=D7CTK1_TRURR|nr:glycoside hydrolase family 43 [Truepera radiovictrix DSM 17093]
MLWRTALAVGLTLATGGPLVAAEAPPPRYTNPVVTPVAADPSVIRADDGRYYLYATQDDWGDGGGSRYVPIFTSPDLVEWTYIGDAFSWPPAWKTGGGFYWAPHITRRGDLYELFYSASLWGDPNPCIGLATARSPEGPFEDLGRPVFCSEDIGVRNSIDPFVWDEGGRRTLIWGSFHGIYAVELAEDGTRAVGEPVRLADTRFEAPWVTYREGFYYLFLSAGSCCDGEWSTYTVYVGRSESLLGPYLDAQGRDLNAGGGDIVLAANDTWVGPGHNAVVTDDAGADWFVYHAIPRDAPRLRNGVNNRPTLIDRLEWRDGWPLVAGPSATEQEGPVVSAP